MNATLKTKIAAGLLCGCTTVAALTAAVAPAGAEGVRREPPPTASSAPNYVTTSHLLVKNLKGYTVNVQASTGTQFVDWMTEKTFTIGSNSEDLHLDAGIDPLSGASHAHWSVALHDANDKSVGLYYVTDDQNSSGDPFWTNIATSHTTPNVKATNVGQSTNQIVRS